MASYIPESLNCFGKRSRGTSSTTNTHSDIERGERAPLLPKQHSSTSNSQPAPHASCSPAETSSLEGLIAKLTRCLAALNAGKMPSQAQLNKSLRWCLASEVLRAGSIDLVDEGEVGRIGSTSRTGRSGRTRPKGTASDKGEGGLSAQSQAFLRALREFIQALLQFGMEKNDDDKIQQLWAELSGFDVALSSLSSEGPSCTSKTNSVLPTTSDAQTLLSSLHTFMRSLASSHLLQGLTGDVLTLLREAIAHTAGDIKEVAQEVQKKAEGKLEEGVKGEGLQKQGEELLGEIVEDAKGVVKGAGKEWQNVEREVKDDVKEKVILRLQKILSRTQKDPAARSAMRSMLTLAKKYAQEVSESASQIAHETDEQVDSALSASESPTPSQSHSSRADAQLEPNYPPDPYGSRHANIAHKGSRFKPRPDPILQDIQTMLERIGGGHSLTVLLDSFKAVVKDLCVVPVVVGEELSAKVEAKTAEKEGDEERGFATPQPQGHQSENGQGGKKGRKGRKAKKNQDSLAASNSSLIPLSPSDTQEGEDLKSENDQPGDKGKGKEQGDDEDTPAQNPLQAYFTQLGFFFDRVLDEPGWIDSEKGKSSLESIFDDGTALTNAIGQSVLEVEDEMSQALDSPAITSPEEQREAALQRQFRNDTHQFLGELEKYFEAVENDKTTMRLARALQHLQESLTNLIEVGQGLRDRLKTWTGWIGWAIPRLLRSIPGGVLPIPSIEVKSGNIEGALHALFVRALKRGEEPVETQLCPDTVVVREWSEVRINMSEDRGGAEEVLDQFGLSPGGPPSPSNPAVETTSRLRVHMDGVRARVEGMGYYFRYDGDWLSYEDEGVISVQVGQMGVPHEGFGLDVEIEFQTEDDRLGPTGRLLRDQNGADFTVEGEAAASAEMFDLPANLDIQRRIGTVVELKDVEPADPLFKVVDVQVEMKGVYVRVDKSRHWLLNKLVVQPLAGPLLVRTVREGVEEKLKSALEGFSKLLGEVVKESRRRGERRRLLKARERAAEVAEWNLKEIEEAETNDALADVVGDWWGAFSGIGLTLLGGAKEGPEATSETRMTGKGIVHSTSSSTSPLPPGTAERTSQSQDDQPMVYHKPTGSMEHVDLTDESGSNSWTRNGRQSEAGSDTEETIIAIGADAQLYPGKGDPENHEAGLREGLDVLQETVKSQWDRGMKTERANARGTWFSAAFDL